MSYSFRPNDYLTTAEASKYLNVTRFTVLNWIKSGKLQSAATFGGHSRIPRGVLQAAMRQIKTTNRVSSPPSPNETDPVINCWESKEIAKCGTHHCKKCLIFKKKLNRCFLAVGRYGSLKRECGHDCINCAYLTQHHPQERKRMLRFRSKAARESKTNGFETINVNGILKKVFYNSGRLVAKLGQLSKGTGSKKHYKRVNKKARKG